MPIATPGPGDIILGGKLLHLVDNSGRPGTLAVQELGSYPRKITIGDPTKDSQDFLSTWIISDLTGGHGLANHQTDATVNRFRFGTLDTTRPGMWTQRWIVHTETGTAGAFWPAGTLLVSGNIEMYGVFGTDLHIWDESTDAWIDTTRNLGSAPVNAGVSFAGTGTLRLFIPRGSSGYTTDDGTTLADVAASGSVPAVREFAILGTLLIALDMSNQLWYSTDGTAWTSFGQDGKIDDSFTAYRVDKYRDSMGNPTLVIATSGGIWVFDPQGPTLYEQDLAFPIHPDQGLAASDWRGIYHVSVGLGLHSWNSATGVIDTRGLDRDEGLPFLYGFNSKIVDLFPAYNEMYALVQGSTADSTLSSVHKWTGRGWHAVWEETATATVTRLYVSQARNTYRVWWGSGNNSHTIELPRGFTNPKQIASNDVSGLLDTAGYLETGFTDMGMAGYRKIAHSCKVRFPHADGNAAGSQFFAQYRTAESEAYTDLHPSYQVVIAEEGTGEYSTLVFWFNQDKTGVVFDEIELKFNSGVSEVIKFATMDFMKIPRRNLSWTAMVDLSASYDDESPESLRTHISDLIDSETFTTLVHKGTTYNVRVASWSGGEETGAHDQRGVMTIQIIEARFEDIVPVA